MRRKLHRPPSSFAWAVDFGKRPQGPCPWGRFLSSRVWRNACDMPSVILWAVLVAGVVTLASQGACFAAPEENISIATLLKGGWQITGYTSTLDDRTAFILFRHPNETYLVQCRAGYDVTRRPPVTSNCYKLQ